MLHVNFVLQHNNLEDYQNPGRSLQDNEQKGVRPSAARLRSDTGARMHHSVFHTCPQVEKVESALRGEECS